MVPFGADSSNHTSFLDGGQQLFQHALKVLRQRRRDIVKLDRGQGNQEGGEVGIGRGHRLELLQGGVGVGGEFGFAPGSEETVLLPRQMNIVSPGLSGFGENGPFAAPDEYCGAWSPARFGVCRTHDRMSRTRLSTYL